MKKFLPIFAILALGIATRFIPHYPNFTAVGAVAILGGSWFGLKNSRFLVTLLLLYVSDLLINNTFYASSYEGFVWAYEGMAMTYLAYLLMAWIGAKTQSKAAWNSMPWAKQALGGSMIFFLITNLSTWWLMPIYSRDLAGMTTALVAGLPFLAPMMLSTFAFGVAMQWSLNFADPSGLKKPSLHKL
jgi:hypothetical protein